MKNADRVFYFDEGPMATPKIITKALQKTQRDQLPRWRHSHELAVPTMAPETQSQTCLSCAISEPESAGTANCQGDSGGDLPGQT